jgi:hypothetical protein
MLVLWVGMFAASEMLTQTSNSMQLLLTPLSST